jgi:hypothetical protein
MYLSLGKSTLWHRDSQGAALKRVRSVSLALSETDCEQQLRDPQTRSFAVLCDSLVQALDSLGFVESQLKMKTTGGPIRKSHRCGDWAANLSLLALY